MNLTKEDTSTHIETTYLFDAESTGELTRLMNQDRMVTQAMGGACAGLPELPKKATILDLACGPGGWVLDVAYTLPDAEVGGVDISQRMIAYANARAHAERISNASFGVMDITKPLDFADGSFDLVHARFLMAVLKQETWHPFVAECTRILRPGGLLQLVEGDDAGRSLSPATERLNTLAMQLLRQTGYGFSPDGHTFGMVPGLLSLLKRSGYRDLHIFTTVLDNSNDSENWANYYHNQDLLWQGIKPLILTYGLVDEQEFESLYQQALTEIYSDDFAAFGYIVSVRGRKQTESGLRS